MWISHSAGLAPGDLLSLFVLVEAEWRILGSEWSTFCENRGGDIRMIGGPCVGHTAYQRRK